MTYAIFPPEDILDTTVARLPLSKSIAARALVLAALTPGAERPSADLLPVCDDIEALCRCLPQRTGKADCGLSGTALRFLTAFYASTEGVDITLRGADGLSRRPVGPLVDSLRQMGAKIEYLEREGFAPLHIVGTTLSASEPVKVDASISSQYVSALCMIAPRIGGLTIDFGAEFPSRPYVEMTLRMLESRYARTRLSRCPHGNGKPSCRRCTIHCYTPLMRERIRIVMRSVGPRMLLVSPITAIRHLIDELT